ncbi:MAG: arylesterase [Alphaproteobacteria bacterium]
MMETGGMMLSHFRVKALGAKTAGGVTELARAGRLARLAMVAVAMMAGMVAAMAGASVARAEPLKILAFGDSLVAGFGLAPEDGFVAQLQQALSGRGHDVVVINGGVSGDTSAGAVARLDWILQDPPDVAIIEFGGTDGLRGLEPAQTYTNLDRVMRRLRRAGVPMLLTGMRAPPNLGRSYGEEFNAVFPRLAETYGTVFYPFFLEGVAAQPALNQADGIHPNADGVAEIVRRLLPLLEPLLDVQGDSAARFRLPPAAGGAASAGPLTAGLMVAAAGRERHSPR